MYKILITGGTGFIGNYLVKKLSNKYLVNLSRKKIINSNIENITCDFAKDYIDPKIFKNVHTVFHLAGIAHDLRESNQTFEKYKLVNVEATKKIAEASANAGVKKFIFLSSTRASKNQVSKIGNNYGVSKRTAEKFLLNISKKFKISISIVRSPLVYGPKSKGNLSVMYNAINQGWFPPLPDKRGKHNMIHVDDLIYSLLLISKELKPRYNIYYVSDGTNYSARDIYIEFCKILNKKIPSWNIPWCFFILIGLFSSTVRKKLSTIFNDQVYSNKKITKLGFVPKKTLRDFNETNF